MGIAARLWDLARQRSGTNRAISAELLAKVPQTRVAGRSAINRTIFDTMLRRAAIDTTAW